MSKQFAALVFLILFILFGCASVRTADSPAISDTSFLNDELIASVNLYDSTLPGNEVSAIYIRCKEELKAALTEISSMQLTAEAILPVNQKCYVKTGEAVALGDVIARLLEFRVVEVTEGAGSVVFVQYYHKGDKTAQVKELAEAMVNCTNDEFIKAASLKVNDKSIYAEISVQGHGYAEDTDYEKRYNYQLVQMDWVKHSD